MRKDMGKVLTERPRTGLRVKSPKGYLKRSKINEESHCKESMKKMWNGGYKDPSDLIGPLFRYLFSKIGQCWDDIYSEISQNIPVSGMDGVHIRQHVGWFVETNTIFVDGEPKDPTGLGLHKDFYLDENRILRKSPDWRWKRSPRLPDPNVRWISNKENECYIKLEGIWYKVIVKPFRNRIHINHNGYKSFLGQVDPITKNMCYQHPDKFWGKSVIGVSKQQINSREIKRLKLND